MVSWPLAKLAEPLAPSAVFRLERKVAGVKPVVTPPTVMVPAVKSIATWLCTTPEELVTATVAWPEKLLTAVGRSSPVLRPVSEAGGGAAVEAFEAAFSAWAVRETNSPSWSERPGSLVLRSESRPPSSPLARLIGCGPAPEPPVVTLR